MIKSGFDLRQRLGQGDRTFDQIFFKEMSLVQDAEASGEELPQRDSIDSVDNNDYRPITKEFSLYQDSETKKKQI